MPTCCILQCRARKGKKQPALTFHRFPRNEQLNRKWKDAIGIKNINPSSKDLFVCSLHFKQSEFNRSLDVVRLRDNIIPSIFLPVNKQGRNIKSERQEIQDSPPTLTSPLRLATTRISVVDKDPLNTQKRNVESERQEIQDSTPALTSPLRVASTRISVVDKDVHIYQDVQASSEEVNMLSTPFFYVKPHVTFPKPQTEEIKRLKDICNRQRLKIKRLHETVRRRDKKIACLEKMLQYFKEEPQLGEDVVVFEVCEESKHC